MTPVSVNYTLAGTATLGSDYNDPGAGKATFAAGSSKATIILPTKDDLLSDPSETIITKITAPTGYTISGPDTATATIIDDDLGTLTLGKTTDGKEAGLVSSVFTLTRTGDLSSALTVNYTLAGTATLGSDYNDPSLSPQLPPPSATLSVDLTRRRPPFLTMMVTRPITTWSGQALPMPWLEWEVMTPLAV